MYWNGALIGHTGILSGIEDNVHQCENCYAKERPYVIHPSLVHAGFGGIYGDRWD